MNFKIIITANVYVYVLFDVAIIATRVIMLLKIELKAFPVSLTSDFTSCTQSSN